MDVEKGSGDGGKVGRKPRNYSMAGGIMRYSQSAMYKKRAIYKMKKPGQASTGKGKGVKTATADRFVEKEISGKENGEKRMVRVKKLPRYYPTEDVPKRRGKKQSFSQHKRRLRPSITPGTILIIVAGRHKGKRVVFLKQLKSGLLLVTGPYKLNGCPLRRIEQIYVIATSSKLDLSQISLPERLTDEYFKRKRLAKPKHQQGEIFDTKKEEYTVSDERKEDQISVDTQVLEAIRSREDKKMMFGYLGANFYLTNNQYPHKMKF